MGKNKEMKVEVVEMLVLVLFSPWVLIMNFLFIPHLQTVPEWKQCYYDYRTLENFMKFINSCVEIIAEMEASIQSAKLQSQKMAMQKMKSRVLQIVELQCLHFKEYSDDEFKVVSVFVWYKIYDIDSMYKSYMHLHAILGRDDQDVQLLVENLYIEAYYLERTATYNVAKQYEIMCNYNKKLSGYVAPFNLNEKQVRIQKQSEKILSKIYFTYTFRDKETNDNLEDIFRREDKSNRMKFLESSTLGLISGCIFACLGVVSLLEYSKNNVTLETNEEFQRDFPAWRGAAEVIFYLWVLGLNILFYQKSQINYRMIFYVEGFNMPKSKTFFLLAATFSFLYLFLLILQIFNFTKTINTGFQSYPQLFWLIFLCYLLNPFPFMNRQGRFQLIRMLFRIICSPCIEMNFIIIWISEQLASLTQPCTDFFFTCCYFFSKDLGRCKYLMPNFNSGLVITIFTYRIIQSLKFWRQLTLARADKKYDFWSPPFLGTLRATSALFASIASIFYRLRLFEGALGLWLTFIIISTLWSWYVDLRGDWGLLNHQTKTLLRQKLLFPKAKYLYYFMGVFDLILRIGWVLTVAPFVINSTEIWPLLFTMIISFIEIFRRGVWNTLRIEYEHIKNCGAYQATIKDDHIYEAAKKKAAGVLRQRIIKKNSLPVLESMQDLQQRNSNCSKLSVTPPLSESELQKVRVSGQLELFQLILKQRQERQNNINKMFAQNKSKVYEILREFEFRRFKSKWETLKSIQI